MERKQLIILKYNVDKVEIDNINFEMQLATAIN